MKKMQQHKGEKFNFLTVISESYRKECDDNTVRTFVKCKCECGNEVEVQVHKLKSNHTQSCGCSKVGKRTHNKSKHPLYRIWDAIRYRCTNKNAINYERYGGRGIAVCDEWKIDFKSFYDYAVSHGWEEGLQIDRIDNNGNYEPSNCRFVTPKQNSRNRRNTVFVETEKGSIVLAEAIENGLINKKNHYKKAS